MQIKACILIWCSLHDSSVPPCLDGLVALMKKWCARLGLFIKCSVALPSGNNNETARALWNGYTSVRVPSDSSGPHISQSRRRSSCWRGFVCLTPAWAHAFRVECGWRTLVCRDCGINGWEVAFQYFSMLIVSLLAQTEGKHPGMQRLPKSEIDSEVRTKWNTKHQRNPQKRKIPILQWYWAYKRNKLGRRTKGNTLITFL